MTPSHDVLPRYRQLRQIMEAHHSQAIKGIDGYRLEKGAKRFGLLPGGILTFGGEEEMTILFDYCLYERSEGYPSVLDRYLDSLAEPDEPLERDARHALRNPRFSIHRVTETVDGLGVRFVDCLADESMFVVDLGFSQTATAGMYLGTRLLPFDGYWTTSGAGFPLADSTAESLIAQWKPRLGCISAVRRESVVCELTRAVLKAGFRNADTQRVMFR